MTTRGNYSCAAVNEVGVGPRGFTYISVYGKWNSSNKDLNKKIQVNLLPILCILALYYALLS